MSRETSISTPFLAAIIAAGICAGIYYAENKEQDSMSKRLYVVTGPQGASLTKRLIMSTTKGTATNHAAKDHFEAKRATAEDVAELLKAGVKIEQAGEQDPQTDIEDSDK
jgi:hypothetical protein